ncbi:MAG TPA: glycosyltransferase [Nocardioidaceae bacterium]|nr:glycosyltransferase [Nocardioidaceae bacterium]
MTVEARSGRETVVTNRGRRGTITLVTSSMEGGGAQRAVAKLASGLAGRGHQVDLVLAHAVGPYLAELPATVRVVDLDVPRMGRAVVPLARYLRRTRPAAIFCALDYVNLVTVVARALARVDATLVVSERNNLSMAAAQAVSRRTRWMPHLIRFVYPHADAVVAVSHGVADDLVATCGLARETVHVLNNPIVTPEVVRMRAQPVEHPWLRDKSLPVVLSVGRLVPQKDFGTLLEAFARARRERPGRLVVLGEGPLRPELERQAVRLGVADDVSFPGFCANPYPAMAAADAFVLSSRWEGSPGALIEAMSCGTPVLATDCPSGPRQILEDGRYGHLLPVGDAGAMAAALVDALDLKIPAPPHESWAPYEQAAVVDAYLDLLLGRSAP